MPLVIRRGRELVQRCRLAYNVLVARSKRISIRVLLISGIPTVALALLGAWLSGYPQDPYIEQLRKIGGSPRFYHGDPKRFDNGSYEAYSIKGHEKEVEQLLSNSDGFWGGMTMHFCSIYYPESHNSDVTEVEECFGDIIMHKGQTRLERFCGFLGGIFHR